MTRGFFITGTDTDVGKTWVTAGVLTALAARGHTTAAMKPVSAGCIETDEGLRNGDALILQRHATLNLPYAQINPYAYAAPIAPHIAATRLGQRIEIAPIKAIFDDMARRADYVVVEGAGGWRVPLNEHETIADLAQALGLPVILVVGMRLGCLNHALLSCESIARQGVPLAGWVANSACPEFPELQENIDALRERIDAPLLGVIPHLREFDAQVIASHLDFKSISS
ncbi:MAG: dethiobiotin synthase [Gammaproteobacteria bacterium]|nr:dethiobiotin synthase [Gammaproteobacteria bacterium]